MDERIDTLLRGLCGPNGHSGGLEIVASANRRSRDDRSAFGGYGGLAARSSNEGCPAGTKKALDAHGAGRAACRAAGMASPSVPSTMTLDPSLSDGDLARHCSQTGAVLITWEFPRLCRGGSRSLTYTAVVRR
jgi:hypothetical protein